MLVAWFRGLLWSRYLIFIFYKQGALMELENFILVIFFRPLYRLR